MTVAIVNLEREFIEIGEDKRLGDGSIPFRSRMAGRGIGWAEVLAHPRVVLLGEAGTGKTTEFKEQRKRCRDADTPAFFARIEELVVHGLELALDPISDWDEVYTWKAGEKRAVFLLDSVDEARLKGQEFGLALRRLAKELGEALNRATVLISCRVSDWQAHADRKMVEDCLPWAQATAESGGRAKQPVVRVFSFVPLNDPQVRRLCREGHGLPTEDTRKFLDDVLAAQAEDFLDRPRDVEWMIGHWRSKRGIGTLTDIIETNIGRKLSEPRHRERPRHADVSDNRMMMGARSLAAAVTFMRKPALRLPDHGLINGVTTDAFDAAAILPDWTEAERQELLSRALFDEATYGRARFHHRSVTEYLAARWVSDRLDRGCPLPEIDGILFPTIYGRRVVAPSLAPVAGWLAGRNDHIRSSALSVAPAILIEHGDPRALPVDTLADILCRAVSQLHDAPHGEESVSYEALERFATPELAPVVRELHGRFIDDARVLSLLLRVIRHGRMRDCADLALRVVLAEESRELRSYGLFALEEAGGPAERAALAAHLLAGTASWTAENLWRALAFCVRGGMDMTVGQFLEIVCRLEVPHHRISDVVQDGLKKIALDHLPSAWLGDVLSGFLNMLLTRPFLSDDEGGRVSARYAGLRSALSRVLIRLLREGKSSEFREDDIIGALDFLDRTHGLLFELEQVEKEVCASVAPHSSLKRRMVWRKAALRKLERGIPVKSYWDIFGLSEGYWALDGNDMGWLLEDIQSLADPDDRALAVACAMASWMDLGRSAEILRLIRQTINGDENLLALVDFEVWLHQRQDMNEVQRAEQKKKDERGNSEAAEIENSKNIIMGKIGDLLSGASIEYLNFIFSRIPGDDSRRTKTNTTALLPRFGSEIAKAARQGLKAYWRRQANSDWDGATRIELMLSGIAMDVEDGLAVTNLSEREVTVAMMVALKEINGFPFWIGNLADAHPDIVRSIILSHVRHVWNRLDGEFLPIFDQLQDAPETVQNLVAKDIFTALKDEPPLGPAIIQEVLRLVRKSTAISRAEVTEFSANWVDKADGDWKHAMICFPLWLDLDGSAALNFLEAKLAMLPQAQADESVMVMCDALPNYVYSSRTVGGLPNDIPSLVRTIAILFRHVRVFDDKEDIHSGRRNHAERVRDSALHRLAGIPGKATHDALLDLADRLATVADPFWFRHLAARRAATDGDPVPWTPEAVVAFERDHEGTPASSTDLHRIVMGRLDWIRRDLETGEFSVRTLFDKRTQETDVQLWLAGALWVRANQRYTVHREEQVDRMKRTDIRLHNANCEGPVCIEIKVMEKGWTVPKLEAALEDQLVGQYLRAHHARHGILLLFRTGTKRTWLLKGRKPMTFEQLLGHLRDRAADLVRRHPQVDRLDVIGMDAGDPS